MRISINNDIKTIQFWLTNDDYSNTNLYTDIDNIFATYNTNKKYRKVIYKSGSCDIVDNTINILRNNYTITKK